MTLNVGPTRSGTDASLLLLRLLVPKPAKSEDIPDSAVRQYFTHTHSLKGRTRLGDKLQQHVVATRLTRCTKSLLVYWKIFVKIFDSATEFTCATCCDDKDFHKCSPVYTKPFVAATCRRDIICCNLSPSVYRCLDASQLYPRGSRKNSLEYTKEHSLYCAI